MACSSVMLACAVEALGSLCLFIVCVTVAHSTAIGSCLGRPAPLAEAAAEASMHASCAC